MEDHKLVMIVDDNYFNVNALSQLITENISGISIIEAFSGKQCLAKIEELIMGSEKSTNNLIDIIFLDINMPQMNGF